MKINPYEIQSRCCEQFLRRIQDPATYCADDGGSMSGIEIMKTHGIVALDTEKTTYGAVFFLNDLCGSGFVAVPCSHPPMSPRIAERKTSLNHNDVIIDALKNEPALKQHPLITEKMLIWRMGADHDLTLSRFLSAILEESAKCEAVLALSNMLTDVMFDFSLKSSTNKSGTVLVTHGRMQPIREKRIPV